MSNSLTLIPCAGNFNQSGNSLIEFSSNAMLSLNGKPVISWILDNLREKEINNPIIISRTDDIQLKDFINWAYQDLELKNVQVKPGNSLLYSIYEGLKAESLASDTSVRIVLGDTLIYDSFSENGDYIYVGIKNDSKRWCTVECDLENTITKLYDKTLENINEHTVASGYYSFTNGLLFCNCVLECILEGEKELSAAIIKYMAVKKVKGIKCSKWYDLGHIDGILNAKRSLINSRSFNTLTINPVLNTITKKSTNNEKLRDELNWYKCLPDELKVLTPRILSTSTDGEVVNIVQEFYGYSTLAELFLYSSISKEIWLSIFQHLFLLNSEFRKYNRKVSSESAKDVYINKTLARLGQLDRQLSFNEILNFQELTINGKKYRNFLLIQDQVLEKLENLCEGIVGSIIHGDFCFSNLLFDINSFIIKLIDPRGSFGEKGIYGDPRYEIAKLRHSAIGKYDFILANLFSIEITEQVINYTIATNDNFRFVESFFDELVVANGYDLNEIRLIEAVLFLTMPPLHSDSYERQLMMYIAGIIKLNEIL